MKSDGSPGGWDHLPADRGLVVEALSRGWRILALVLVCAVSAAEGQRDDGDELIPKDRLTVRETINVRLVHLDAVVTDRSGEPLVDLQPSDFDLRVDGKRVEVTGVSQGRELRETLTGRLTIVVFLDQRHLQKSHRDRVLDEIARELATEMKENPTWVALTALSDRLEPLLAPTRDVEAVLDALERAKGVEVEPSELRLLQRRTANEVRDLLRQLSRSGSTYRFGQVGLSGLAVRTRAYGEALAGDTLRTLTGIEGLVEALAFVPGRKAVLFLTDGLPREPLGQVAKTMYERLAGGSVLFEGDDIVADLGGTQAMNDTKNRPTGSDRIDQTGGGSVYQEDDGGASQFQRIVADLSCSKEFDHLAALANTHRVTFYPLKPPVVDPLLSGLGERQGERDSITSLSDMLDGLRKLAAATGGLAFTSQTGVAEFLRRTREDVSTYYSLTFTPPESMRGSGIRHMELKVRRKRAHIRHRASYVSITLEQNIASRAWGTLLFDWEDNVHRLEVATKVEATAAETAPVEVLLSLPIERLSLVPSGQVVAGSFRVVVTLRDGTGFRLRAQHLGFVVEVAQEDLATANEQFFAVRTRLDLAPGSYDMVIGLWEENTASSSYVTHKIEVESKDPAVAMLAPEMLSSISSASLLLAPRTALRASPALSRTSS